MRTEQILVTDENNTFNVILKQDQWKFKHKVGKKESIMYQFIQKENDKTFSLYWKWSSWNMFWRRFNMLSRISYYNDILREDMARIAYTIQNCDKWNEEYTVDK